MALENNNNIEYKNNKAIIKALPKNGENLSVFLRPGDEVVFQLDGVNPDALEYVLIGGDIVVSLPGLGALTFPSLGLMGFSGNAPKLNFGNGKLVSIDDIFSRIQEVNELPIESVNASFKMKVNTVDEETGLLNEKVEKTPNNPPVIVIPQNQISETIEEKRETLTASYEQNRNDYQTNNDTVLTSKNTFYENPYTRNITPTDFDAYKPDVEMIPKPDVEMIPKPDYETMPKNDFTDYFPDDGSGNGNGNVSEAAKPAFYFKGTAHQVIQSEISQSVLDGGGGSINGHLYDSITNQFEAETIDASAKTENLDINADSQTYFKSGTAETHTLTFQDLHVGQSITVNGLTLTATGTIVASDVAKAFANISSGATSGTATTYGTWSGTASSGWSSGAVTDTKVTFTSTVLNDATVNITSSQSGSTIAAATAVDIVKIEGNGSTTETHTITFKDMIAGQSITVGGLTLTTTGNMSASEVATAFANLNSGATSGNTVTNGLWSGTTLSAWSSDAASGDTLTFTSTTANTDVVDIAVSRSGETIVAAPAALTDSIAAEVVDVSLSRVLRFAPQMPEGFYVENFSISGLPSEVTLLDKNGNPISGTTISQEDLIFRNALGEIITPDSANFLTEFKSAEFVMQYENSITEPFNVSITSTYQLDASYAGTTDIESTQTFSVDYTFAVKDITSADDYTYKQSDFSGGKADGFILAKNPNDTIIKDGSGSSTIYGGISKDTVYDGAGDDTIYLNAGNDTVYAGSGTNYIYGDSQNATAALKIAGTDTVNYSTVQSFSASEAQLLENQHLLLSGESEKLSGTSGTTSLDQQMLASNKGVYVDLDGVYVPELNIDVNKDGDVDSNDKINAISKFADREGRFTYDEDGNADSTTLTNIGLDDLQAIGYDIYEDVENVTGSRYDDTLYGNAQNNTLSGGAGSDTIDGRSGNNMLLGGDGYDTLIAGSGNDTIDGGADTDAVSYQNATEGMTIRLDRPHGEQYDYAALSSSPTTEKDKITNIEDVIGSGYNDTIYGNNGTNFIQAGAGDDRIFAGGGYDFIDGGTGSDWISYLPRDYPNLSDNPSFMQTINGISVDLNSSDFVMVKETSTNRLIDLVKSVEQVSATDGNDVIYGANSAETFWGHAGNDTLWGRGGNDTIDGGSGNDTIRPGSGFDDSDGGDGIDYVELYDDGLQTQALRLSEDGTVQHSLDSGTTWVDGYKTGSGTETAINFEGFGASSGDDTIYGNSQDNIINGHQGSDTLYGMIGNDTMRGGDGADTIDGGEGNDILYGERNNDTITAGAGDDIVYGHGRYDTGIENKDTLNGGDGIDTLNYTSTRDALVLDLTTVDGNGYATAKFEQATGGATGAYNDLVKNFETIIGGNGNDTITAAITDVGNNIGMTLDGWGGRDTLTGSAGDDTIIARNTSGEILNGNAGDDTLQLAQNVDFRNITVSNFESLSLGNYYAYFNTSQFFTNNTFAEISGGDSSRIYLYGTNNADTLNFTSIDFTNFTGSIYAYSYNGNDTFDFTDSTLNGTMKLYLDAGGGTDTLKLGISQTASMLDNYYNTFEDFDVGANSTLNIMAYNNSGRTFYADSKNFNDIFVDSDLSDGDDSGKINLIGGTGNDTFYANYEALLAGKLSIDGNTGIDMVDVRTTATNSALTFNDPDMFSNIERLELDQISSTNTITMDATAVDDWLSSDTLVLDLNNTNAQSTKVTMTDTQGADMTSFVVGNTYSITPDDNDTFALQVV